MGAERDAERAGGLPGRRRRRTRLPRQCPHRNFWWVTEPAAPLYNATGIYGQSIFVHGPRQVVVAKLSSWPDPLSTPMRRTTIAAVNAIAKALATAPRPA